MPFHHFPSLPLELRLKIYSYALPSPQILNICAILISKGPIFDLVRPEQRWQDGRFKEASHMEVTGCQHIERCYASPRDSGYLMAFMSVCREVRTFVSRHFQSIEMGADASFSTKGIATEWEEREKVYDAEHSQNGVVHTLERACGERKTVLFDPEGDVLFLRDVEGVEDHCTRNCHDPAVSTLDVLSRWLHPPVLKSLQNFACPYYTWAHEGRDGRLPLLRSFEGLRHVWVVMLADEGVGKSGLGWMSGLTVKIPHLEEVVLEVEADVLELQRMFKDWNVPSVKVVEDRKALERELQDIYIVY